MKFLDKPAVYFRCCRSGKRLVNSDDARNVHRTRRPLSTSYLPNIAAATAMKKKKKKKKKKMQLHRAG